MPEKVGHSVSFIFSHLRDCSYWQHLLVLRAVPVSLLLLTK